MATKQSGLGRGLGDLFARTDDGTPAPLGDGSRFAELPVDAITPNPQQPRTVFDEDDLGELAESIREFVVLQPVVVRESGRNQYELIMSERRLRASKLAERATIPAIIRGTEDTALLRDAQDNAYALTLPASALRNGSPQASGPNADVTATYTIEGAQDLSQHCIQLDRLPVAP